MGDGSLDCNGVGGRTVFGPMRKKIVTSVAGNDPETGCASQPKYRPDRRSITKDQLSVEKDNCTSKEK